MKINLQTWCLDPREQRKKYFGDELDFGFLCPMSKCLGVCRGFCFKPQSCHSKTEMTNKKRESRERENEVINQIQQTDVSENG